MKLSAENQREIALLLLLGMIAVFVSTLAFVLFI